METIAPVVFGLIVLLVLFMIYRQIALLLQKVTERPLTEDAPSEEGQAGREESFWQWFSTSSVAVWLIHDNVVKHINPSGEQLLSLAQSEIQGGPSAILSLQSRRLRYHLTTQVQSVLPQFTRGLYRAVHELQCWPIRPRYA